MTWLGAETSEKFIPQMLGYEQIGAVSFSKGCYPGQEIVARARYLGKVKRKPVIVRTSENLAASGGIRWNCCAGKPGRRELSLIQQLPDEGTLLFIVAPVEPEVIRSS